MEQWLVRRCFSYFLLLQSHFSFCYCIKPLRLKKKDMKYKIHVNASFFLKLHLYIPFNLKCIKKYPLDAKDNASKTINVS